MNHDRAPDNRSWLWRPLDEWTDSRDRPPRRPDDRNEVRSWASRPPHEMRLTPEQDYVGTVALLGVLALVLVPFSVFVGLAVLGVGLAFRWSRRPIAGVAFGAVAFGIVVVLTVGWGELAEPVRDLWRAFDSKGLHALAKTAQRRWQAWIEPAWLGWPLGGFVGAVVLDLLARARPEWHPKAEKVRERTSRNLARVAAARARRAPDTTGGALVLGAPASGDLSGWLRRDCLGRRWLTYPPGALGRHCVLVGESGSGKTETELRIAYGAAKAYGWRVFFVDAKGDPATQERFAGLMLSAGVPAEGIRLFPQQPYNGWRAGGDPIALLNRLLAIEDFTEPYYRSQAKLLLDLAVTAPAGVPRKSADLLSRLGKDGLLAAYRGFSEAGDAEGLEPRAAATTYGRYRAFFRALGGKRDGSWAFEDARAAYFRIDGLALKDHAESLGRFLLEDFAHFVSRRKEPSDRVLLIIDEFSTFARAADAANLFERVRSYGAGIVAASQSVAGLGEDAEAARILDAAHAVILHRTADPERIANRAGTRRELEVGFQTDSTGPTGLGTARMQDVFRVPPQEVRTLQTGECFVIAGGRAAQVSVARAPDPSSASHQAAELFRRCNDSESQDADMTNSFPEAPDV
ncbi:MAG: TraM recognition domain-containing protein [Actinomycetota bacterium]